MITSNEPDSWQSLQTHVGRILEECGFDIEIEKKQKTVRGEVELDVYAEESVNGRKYSIACECKYWNKAVSQNVVHSYRTVLADIGSNLGYIVSKNGFQSGAICAAEKTNIKLVTWSEFQKEFEASWLNILFVPSLEQYHYINDVPRYIDENASNIWLERMKWIDRDYYLQMLEKKEELGDFIFFEDVDKFMNIVHQCVSSGELISELLTIAAEELPKLPLLNRVNQRFSFGWYTPQIPLKILESRGFRECLEETLAFRTKAISNFHNFRPNL